MLKEDSSEVEDEFGEFLTRNVINRIPEFHFEEELFELDGRVDVKELQKVIERERYIEYSENMPGQAYTGDLFKDSDTYYLNIRAQCDLARKDDKVELYLIKGKVLDTKDIVTEDIRLVSEGELKFPNKVYTLDEIQKICRNAADGKEGTVQELQEINEQFRKKAGTKRQLLHAYEMVFPVCEGHFSYLSQKSFQAPLPNDFLKAMEYAKIHDWKE